MNLIKNPGTYNVLVKNIVQKVSKKSGKPMFVVEYETLNGEVVSDFLMIEGVSKDGKPKLNEFAERNATRIKKACGDVQTMKECVGKTITITVENKNNFMSVVKREQPLDPVIDDVPLDLDF